MLDLLNFYPVSKLENIELEQKIEKMLNYMFKDDCANVFLTETEIITTNNFNDNIQESVLLALNSQNEMNHFIKYTDGNTSKENLKRFIKYRAYEIAIDIKPYKDSREDFTTQWKLIKSKIKTVHFIIYDEKMEARCNDYGYSYDGVYLYMHSELVTEINLNHIQFITGE